MTVQDLLRHTSGLIYGTRGKSLVNEAYIDAKIGSRDVSLEEFVTKVSHLPLRFSPGDRWDTAYRPMCWDAWSRSFPARSLVNS